LIDGSLRFSLVSTKPRLRPIVISAEFEFENGRIVRADTTGRYFRLWLNDTRSCDQAAVLLWTGNVLTPGKQEQGCKDVWPLLRATGLKAACWRCMEKVESAVCDQVQLTVECYCEDVQASTSASSVRRCIRAEDWSALVPLSQWQPRVIGPRGGVRRVLGTDRAFKPLPDSRTLAIRVGDTTVLLECSDATDAWLRKCEVVANASASASASAGEAGCRALPRLLHAPPLLTSSGLAARGVPAGGQLDVDAGDAVVDPSAVLIALTTALSENALWKGWSAQLRWGPMWPGVARAEQVLAFALRPDTLLAPSAPAAFGALLLVLLKHQDVRPAAADGDGVDAAKRMCRFVAERRLEVASAGMATEDELVGALSPLLSSLDAVPDGLSRDALLFLARASQPLGHLLAAWTWRTGGGGGGGPPPTASLRELRRTLAAATRKKKGAAASGKRRRPAPDAATMTADDAGQLMERLLGCEHDRGCRLMRSWYDAYCSAA
jgi:hypothetical protein